MMFPRAAGVVAGAAVGCAFFSSLTTSFVSSAPGSRQAKLPTVQSYHSGQPITLLTSGAACTAVAVAVAMTYAVGARLARARSQVVQSATRRELAVAYEDSGISLIDNGKFAQGLIGAEGAWGRYEFDPVGFSKYTELVPYFREAELKHGRIAMLAWLGLAVPDFVRIPGDRYSFEAVPVTIDAHDKFNGAVGVNFQILFWIAIVEFCCAKKVFEWNSIEVAGDYGLTALLPKDEEGQRKMRLSELKNGRLAMVAFGGAITQAVITRHPFPWLF